MNPEVRAEAIEKILKEAINLGKIDANSIKEWSGNLGDNKELFFRFQTGNENLDLYSTISNLSNDLDLYITHSSELYTFPADGRAGNHKHYTSATNRGTVDDQLFVRLPSDTDGGEYLLRVANNQDLTEDTINSFKLELDTQSFQETTLFPSDPYLQDQWYLFNNSIVEIRDALSNSQLTSKFNVDIAAPEAWKQIHDASDIIVAVIDSGIDYEHPDLINNMWVNQNDPINGEDDDGNGYKDDYYGWNFAENSNNPMDQRGHGTHVAGIIGAEANNNQGVSGIAWKTQLMPIVPGGATPEELADSIAQSLHYAIDHGADVINLSLGWEWKDAPEVSMSAEKYQSLNNAFQKAHDNDIFITISSGNEREDVYSINQWNDIGNIDASSSIPTLFSQEFGNIAAVSSSNARGALASYSSGGTKASIAAPGGDIGVNIMTRDPEGVPIDAETFPRYILSTVPQGKGSEDYSNNYDFKGGTSMAAPVVAGAAALIRAANSEIAATETLAILRRSAFTYPELNNLVDGNRSLNLHGSVAEALAWNGLTNFIGHQLGNNPVFDFSDFTSAHTIHTSLTIERNADLDLEMGLFRVLDAQGTLLDPTGQHVLPGDEGYRELALSSRNLVDELTGLSVADGESMTTTATLSETDFLSPYVIAGDQIFFAFNAANTDGLQHIRPDGLNGFLVEDTIGGGDESFDDLTIRLNFSDLQ